MVSAWLELLSFSVYGLSFIYKIPMLIRVYQMKNVEGISTSSILLEQTTYTLILAYNIWRNYPISAYLEYISVSIQNLLLLLAIAKYSIAGKDKPADRSKPLFGIVIFLLYLLASCYGLVPEALLNMSTMVVIPIGAASKIVQIRMIIANKSAGQVRRGIWGIAMYSNTARIITYLVQTKDIPMILTLSISLILNTALFIVCSIYSEKSTGTSTDEKKRKTIKTQ